MGIELTEQVRRHLADDEIAWLTTVTPSRRPAPRPVWFGWDGSTITIYSMPGAAKLRHIQVNDQVSLHFQCADDGSDVVVISGRAEIAEGAPLPSQNPGLLDRYRVRIQAMGFTPEWYDSYSTAILVTPERVWTI